ncbi:MAG: 4a-hydroxytetrahydrobiopterin dehydratase [Pseudonocardiaceae bacterium]
MAELWDDEQIKDALTGLTDWRRDGNAIVRTAKLPSFPAAIEAVRAVADIAEARNHHPDIDIRWRTLTFRCSTHSAGGITGKDIELAGEIDQVLAATTS